MSTASERIISKKIRKISYYREYCDSFDIGPNSIFLDIGSGLGRPVLDIAVTSNCLSLGIEVVDSRIQGSINLLAEASKAANVKTYDESPLSNVRFFKDDCLNLRKLCSYTTNDG